MLAGLLISCRLNLLDDFLELCISLSLALVEQGNFFAEFPRTDLLLLLIGTRAASHDSFQLARTLVLVPSENRCEILVTEILNVIILCIINVRNFMNTS